MFHCPLAMRPLMNPAFHNPNTWALLSSASWAVSYVSQASRLWPCFQPASTSRNKLIPAPLCRAVASRGVLPLLSKGLLMRSSRCCRVPSRARRAREKSYGNLPQGDRAGSHGAC